MNEAGETAHPGPAGRSGLFRLAAAWALGLDTLAGAASAAVSAGSIAQLRVATAEALSGPFADWAVVDILGTPSGAGPAIELPRAVAAAAPDPDLAAMVAAVPAQSSPLIASVLRRCTPEVLATIGNEWLLGRLADDRPVTSAIGAWSVAAGPIVADGAACGTLTITRGPGQLRLGFRELGILAQIGELTGAAVHRLRCQ